MAGTSSGNARDRNRRWYIVCSICTRGYILSNQMVRTRGDGSKTDVHELACERKQRASEPVAAKEQREVADGC